MIYFGLVTLLLLFAVSYAQSANVPKVKDLNETNTFFSGIKSEDMCGENFFCKGRLKCLFFGFGVERFCLHTCDVDADCPKNKECVGHICVGCNNNDDCEPNLECTKSFLFGSFCQSKSCKKDNDCGDSVICYKNSSVDENGHCARKCNCGSNETCIFEEGKKTCACYPGFIEVDGKCKECNCGRKGACSFEKGEKKCVCDSGFFEKNGKCTDCICKGGNCVMEDKKEVCKCPPGYGNFTNFSCKACDCGPDTNCIWEARFGGDKICLCKPGYSSKKGKCEVCDCGPDSSCEWISEGWLKPEIKVCHCKEGFHEKEGKCVNKQDLRRIMQGLTV